MIPYVLQESTSSRCKHCKGYVKLLIEEGKHSGYSITDVIKGPYGYEVPRDLPAFFICFNCNKVFQAGLGELELVKGEE